jgi:hypothetical protein
VKLRIKDKFYDHIAARNDGSLGMLRDLKRATGLGRQSLERELAKFGDTVKSSDEIFEDPELLQAVIALAWLCKRHAGEAFTFAEAEALQFTDLEFIADDSAEGDEESDPTQPPVVTTARRKNAGESKNKKTLSAAS